MHVPGPLGEPLPATLGLPPARRGPGHLLLGAAPVTADLFAAEAQGRGRRSACVGIAVVRNGQVVHFLLIAMN
jgi:hypothetical protein